MKKTDPELLACAPHPLNPKGFNQKADIPYGCTIKHISRAMSDLGRQLQSGWDIASFEGV